MDQPTCLVCGATLEIRGNGRGPRRKWCSRACANDGYRLGLAGKRGSAEQIWRDPIARMERKREQRRRPSVVRSCLGCGVLIICGGRGNFARVRCDECRVEHHKVIQQESQKRIARQSRPCPLGRSRRVLRWSDPVRVKWRKRPKPKSVVECRGCGQQVTGTNGRQFCSKRCSDSWHNRHRFPDGTATPIAFGECRECSRLFVRRVHQLGAYCGNDCRKRAHKRTRRHALRAAGEHEHFTLREIADRDGWKCHLCHRKINPLLDPQHDRAASIDHLIPVSSGGAHVRLNVAIAHRDCNWRRSVGGVVQLRLTG